MTRAFTDREGDLRTLVLVGVVGGAGMLLALGTWIALLAADLGSPATLALWTTAAFVLIKVPLLALIWWVIARRRDPVAGGGWGSRECREIREYLEVEARASVGRPDAPTRLAYYAREAWFVADRASDADRPASVDTAVLIEAMAAEAGAPIDRSQRGRPTAV